MGYYTNKLVLITGGSSGIGFALAKNLIQKGAHVFILARRQELLQQACKTMDALRANKMQQIDYLVADVSNENQLTEIICSFIKERGVPDILINCASIAQPGLFEDQETNIFRSMMDVNYFGTLYPIKTLLPAMLDRGSGHIINFSSVAGFLGVYGYSSYGAAKFAVRGLTDTIRAEYKSRGIKFSIVFPSDTDTPQHEYEMTFRPEVTNELIGHKSMTAEKTAVIILNSAARGIYIITPGFDATLYYILSITVGVLTYPIMDFIISKAKRRLSRKKNPGA